MRRSTTALAAWTLVVWLGRLRNDLGALPVVFLGLAVAALVGARRDDRRPAVALAATTVVVWVVRAVDIAALSDHDAAFVAVHLVLAAVSIALAAWVLSGVRERVPAPST